MFQHRRAGSPEATLMTRAFERPMTRSDDRRFSNTANTAVSNDAQILDSDQSGFETDHVPAPAPHVGGDPPRAYRLFGRFQLDAGGDAWVSAKYPVDVAEVA
ncbi:hypothetical protein DVK07_12625 [Halorubrum sp. Atlit-26R]|nr:hypothetical protein DVK07_12625 [Halorubrum sp. Atlit-26R]